MDASFTYDVQLPLQPTVSFEYAFGSGDSDRTNVTDAISGTIYLSNFAPLLTNDQKSVRFPFVDATGLANNNTSVGFSLSATY
jgi:hypothetical protein